MLAAGCGGKGVVSGKVLYQNKPVRGGNVSFLLESGGVMSSAIEEDGSYTIANVPPGNVKITVETDSFRPSVQQRDAGGAPAFMKKYIREKDPQAAEERAKRYVKIPPQYSDPDKSNLTYAVKSGKQDHDIDLK
jgi:allophanate hydrolase subunit 1